MQKTSIEWVRNPDGTPGYTFNPITGCLNGCMYCYARNLAHTRLRKPYTDESGELPSGYDTEIENKLDPFYPRFWPDKAYYVPQGKPKGIFTVNMGDMFGPWVPDEWIEQVLETIGKRHPWHRFYLLTKFPENLAIWSPFPRNCWVGVTATDAASYMTALKHLVEVSAAVRYISFEPLLGEVINNERDHGFCNLLAYSLINWVIIGAQTKPLVLPERYWVDEIIEAADLAGIPVFLKDSLAGLYPEGLRQEMPS